MQVYLKRFHQLLDRFLRAILHIYCLYAILYVYYSENIKDNVQACTLSLIVKTSAFILFGNIYGEFLGMQVSLEHFY